MFSFFGTIAGYLGYINLSVKLKNQIYTILASGGNFYLLYVAYRFFVNGFVGRGTLFILAFLIIAYFAYLNFLYYFTTKSSKYDISPKIEKMLGIAAKDPLATTSKSKPQPGFVQTNGIFSEEKLLPTIIDITPTQQQNLNMLVAKLEASGYLQLDYGQKDEASLLAKASQDAKPVYALQEPVVLPYFELQVTPQGLFVYGGLNQLEKYELAQIKTIGLLAAKNAQQDYDLTLATVVVQKGHYRRAGRASLMPETKADFALEVKVAYKEKA